MTYNVRTNTWKVKYCPTFNQPLDGWDRFTYDSKESFGNNAILASDEDYEFLMYGALTSELRN